MISPRLVARLENLYDISKVGCKTGEFAWYLQGWLQDWRIYMISPRLVARLENLRDISKVDCKIGEFIWYLQGWLQDWRICVISPRLIARLENLEANSKLNVNLESLTENGNVDPNLGEFGSYLQRWLCDRQFLLTEVKIKIKMKFGDHVSEFGDNIQTLMGIQTKLGQKPKKTKHTKKSNKVQQRPLTTQGWRWVWRVWRWSPNSFFQPSE